MILEKQVTSLETSKKLKELGVEQESIFFWIQTYDSTLAPILNHSIARTPDVRGDLYLVDKSPIGRNYSAFTASELAEMLPTKIDTRSGETHYLIINRIDSKQWDVSYDCQGYVYEEMPIIKNESLVEALAACLIYLKENKLI